METLELYRYLVSAIIVVTSGLSMLVFLHYNRYKRVERFFYFHNKYLYILLQLCYYLLFISFVFNSRFIVYEVAKYIIYINFHRHPLYKKYIHLFKKQ